MMDSLGYLQLVGIPFSLLNGLAIDKIAAKTSKLTSLTLSSIIVLGKLYDSYISCNDSYYMSHISSNIVLGLIISGLQMLDGLFVSYLLFTLIDFYRISIFSNFVNFIIMLFPSNQIGRLNGLLMVCIIYNVLNY